MDNNDDLDAIFGNGRVSHFEEVGECMCCGRKGQKVLLSYDEAEGEYFGATCLDVEECGFYFRARTEGM